MSIVNKITSDIINRLVIEFKKNENKKIINDEILSPLMECINEYICLRLYSFFLIGTVMFILIFTFVFIILIFIIKLNLKKH